LTKYPILIAVITNFCFSSVLAETFSGYYLAARQANHLDDFEASAHFNSQLIALDASNISILESLIVAKVAIGDIKGAMQITDTLAKLGATSQMVHLLNIAKAVKAKNFDTILAQLGSQKNVGHHLVNGLIRGWAMAGRSQLVDAFAQFDKLATDPRLANFGIFHKALLYMAISDYQSASETLENLYASSGQTSVRGARIHIQALMMQGDFDKAERLFEKTFGSEPSRQLIGLQNDLKVRRKPRKLVVTEPSDGIAEIFFSVAQILSSDENDQYTLAYARLAEYLLKETTQATLLSAQILSNMEQFDLATRSFSLINANDPLYTAAQIGKADALSQSGKYEEAIEVLQELIIIAPEMVTAYQALGDDFRSINRFDDAVLSYSSALDLMRGKNTTNWILYYSRGIAYEQLGDWINAEKDFRRALEIKPDQPYVLNYLGYSLVEKQLKLEEALSLIEKAVSLRPDSGYIVDSFGWVLFRLSRFVEAVPHLEKAAKLMPVDPIVNDHLGDVYWAVGRKREARFQWNRALSFDPEDADQARIVKKLEIGLDQVLIEEGNNLLEFSKSDD